ncbi:MAG: acyl-CoA dehydrogenase family protein, partial [Candidatus Aminicenantaceae bacterium]
MNFELTEEQSLLKEMVRDFAQKEIAPIAKSMEESKKFPRELFKKLGELGILGTTVPSEYGGTKTDTISFMVALEEISSISPALAVIV